MNNSIIIDRFFDESGVLKMLPSNKVEKKIVLDCIMEPFYNDEKINKQKLFSHLELFSSDSKSILRELIDLKIIVSSGQFYIKK